MQTQTSNTLHNAIMEAGRVITFSGNPESRDTLTPNLIMNPSTIVSKIHHININGQTRMFQFLKVVLKRQLKGIDNDIYSTVDACPNACEMWKAIERLKQGKSINVQDFETNLYWEFGKFTSRDGESLESYYSRSQQAATRNRGKVIVNSPPPTYDQEPSMVAKDDEMVKDKEIDKLMALISLSFKKIYKPTNNNLRTSSNTSTPVVYKSGIHCYNYKEYRHVVRECQKPKRAKDAAYHKENMLLFEQDAHIVIIDSLDMSYDREQIDQDDDYDLANERDLLASLIEKLKCEIDDSKNRNKFLETSNKVLVDKLKGEIKDFKTKNKSLESSNNHFKEASNELSKINQLMYKDLKKFQAELDRHNDVKYASKTQKINDLNQTILEMKNELFAHQETISIMSQQKEAQIKFYKTREDKEMDKVIALENKVKVLDNIVYKTGQSVQTMNMINRNCKTSFAKPKFLKKSQRSNPRLYDIGCYNDNLALMLSPESDDVIRLEKESRSKLSDLITPFDYEKLNNLYDLFVPQREKSSAQ
nr:hypothetical protein [Tanacetum cinerariifolium]